MKTKRYIITTGCYEDYQIIGAVEGPERPALSTLLKQFGKEFGFPDPPKGRTGISASAMEDRFNSIHNAIGRFKKAISPEGKNCYSAGETFLSWLEDKHGFSIVPENEIHMPW